jgi:hypothetical protein
MLASGVFWANLMSCILNQNLKVQVSKGTSIVIVFEIFQGTVFMTWKKMGNRAKSLFCSVFFYEFHHKTKLMALLFSDFVFKRKLSTQNNKTLSLKFSLPPIQIPTQNGKMKILWSEFYSRTNLTTLWFANIPLKHGKFDGHSAKILKKFWFRAASRRIEWLCQFTVKNHTKLSDWLSTQNL